MARHLSCFLGFELFVLKRELCRWVIRVNHAFSNGRHNKHIKSQTKELHFFSEPWTLSKSLWTSPTCWWRGVTCSSVTFTTIAARNHSDFFIYFFIFLRATSKAANLGDLLQTEFSIVLLNEQIQYAHSFGRVQLWTLPLCNQQITGTNATRLRNGPFTPSLESLLGSLYQN